MLKKVIAIDMQNAENIAKGMGLPYFPVKEFRSKIMQGNDVDVIEMLATVVLRVPEDETPEAKATVTAQVEKKQYALEMSGAKVIICPAKPTQGGGYKHSDDQRLMITTLSCCMKLRPDFLVFVGGDGDYAPMLWELRNEGIRIEVVADPKNLANDLRRVAYNVVDLNEILRKIKEEMRA